MTGTRSYATPGAFRRALTDKLRTLAGESQWSLQQLQRQMAYDRLLERLYLVDDGWIVKGATALLARELSIRATIDIDLYRAVGLDLAEQELRQAAGADIGDWFRFELGAGRPAADGVDGNRIPVATYVGATEWARFHVDLVGVGVRMTGEPDAVPALARVAIADVEQHGYKAYPLVDHIADKVAAILDRYGDQRVPSTRYKDLVDLVAIVSAATVDAGAQQTALTSELERRGISSPERFGVPDVEMWNAGYEAEAKRSRLPVAPTLDRALALVTPFVNPVLSGAASGSWEPTSARWTP